MAEHRTRDPKNGMIPASGDCRKDQPAAKNTGGTPVWSGHAYDVTQEDSVSA